MHAVAHDELNSVHVGHADKVPGLWFAEVYGKLRA